MEKCDCWRGGVFEQGFSEEKFRNPDPNSREAARKQLFAGHPPARLAESLRVPALVDRVERFAPSLAGPRTSQIQTSVQVVPLYFNSKFYRVSAHFTSLRFNKQCCPHCLLNFSGTNGRFGSHSVRART